jgi:hypothetical protein
MRSRSFVKFVERNCDSDQMRRHPTYQPGPFKTDDWSLSMWAIPNVEAISLLFCVRKQLWMSRQLVPSFRR